MIALIPHVMENMNSSREGERIAALRQYNILDTPPDDRFDRFTRLAAQATGSPLALISFVDSDRIWFKSVYGARALKQTGHEPGFCLKTILADDCHIVEDVRKDPDACLNSFAGDIFGIRSYAGMPLKSKSGYPLGAICVMDRQPRLFSGKEIMMLSDLRNMLMDFLEFNQSVQCYAEGQRRILRRLAHDIRNPLTVISLQTQILKMEPHLSPEEEQAFDQIKNAGKKIATTIYDLISS